ncbi:MAG TPA: hypothetical protein VJ904_09555, partial [Tichowtungia sp.]|nr:hypothetical protein [Tichowtungia sp.]
DECNLTLSELNAVKQSFIFSLTNMLHGRVAYPKESDGKKGPKKEASDDESGGGTPGEKNDDET